MENYEEMSLAKMLMYMNIPGLPEKNDENLIWAIAFVKVLRRNGRTDYAVAEHDMFSWKEVRIIKENVGAVTPVDVLEIYPICYVNDTDMPRLKEKEDIIKYISINTSYDPEKLKMLSNGKLKDLFCDILIKARISKWKNMANRNKEQEEHAKPADQKITIEEYKDSLKNVVTDLEEYKASVKGNMSEETPEKVTPDIPVLYLDERRHEPVCREDNKRKGRKPKAL